MSSEGETTNLFADTVYFTGPRAVELRREPIHLKEDEILVESELIGISCGTELLLYRNEFPKGPTEDAISGLPSTLSYPTPYGYMNVCRDRENNRYFAFAPHSTRFGARIDALVPIGGLPAEDAVFAASMETALGIVQDTNPLPGDHVLVLGQGIIGLLVADLLRADGLVSVYVSEPAPFRRQKACEAGTAVLPADSAEASELLFAATEGRGVDTAINVSGSDTALQFAIDHLAYEGRVVEASWFGEKSQTLALGTRFHRKRLTLTASQVSNVAGSFSSRWSKDRRMRFVVELLGKFAPSRYITHRFSLRECDKAFALLDDPRSEVLQPVFVPAEEPERSPQHGRE
ncbi:MAG: zinc-dependent alcohol dehydrogenase [Spirochaetales bacterium]